MIADPVARLVIYGTPGTAGSKSAFPIHRGTGADRHFTGRVAVVESKSATKTTWRKAVLDEARGLCACKCPDPDCTATVYPFPLDEALVASMVFTVKKPASAPKLQRSWPSARPDLLKYCRATEDHLTDAGLIKDDARIVDYRRMAKVYPGEDPDALAVPGAVITVWRMVDLQRDLILAPTPQALGLPTLFESLPTEGT